MRLPALPKKSRYRNWKAPPKPPTTGDRVRSAVAGTRIGAAYYNAKNRFLKSFGG